MKKYLLFASSAFFAISANAQNTNVAAFNNNGLMERIDINTQNIPFKPTTAPNAKANATVVLGTSFNVFGTLGDRQNQVVYNPDVNTVGFVHRQRAGGTVGGAYATGVMEFDYSTDGGATWSRNNFPTTPTGNGATWTGNRYPNMGIYNPGSNTDTANIFIVQAGPALASNPLATTAWAHTFRASAKLDGTNVDETYDFNAVVGPNDPNEWGCAGLYVNALGDAWYVSTNINNQGAIGSENPIYDLTDEYSKYFLVKGTFNATNSNFDWACTDTITPGWHSSALTAGQAVIAGLPNMAWSANGNIGYMVIMGADSTMASGGNYSTRPYVHKTTDGGANWNLVADQDFKTDATFLCALQTVDGGTSALINPRFGAYDMVVDQAGDLRMLVNITSGSSLHPDSAFFAYTAPQTQFLFEVAHTSAGWETNFIDSVYVANFVYDATNNLSHFIRPQASRSQDGSKVFYTWQGVDPILASPNRDLVDVFGVGHEISTNMWTPVTDLSTGNSSQYTAAYQTMAVDVNENGVDKAWELMIVYAQDINSQTISDGAAPVTWNFITGIGFDQSEFTMTAFPTIDICNPPVSVNELKLADNSVSIYPNPTNGVVEIQLTDATNFNYTIVDVIGNVVSTNTVNGNKTVIDLTNNAKGVYFVTINTEAGSITKKVMLTK